MMSRKVIEWSAELRKNHLPNIKERENVLYAFIPWSVPAQILYKEDGAEKLTSFSLSNVQFLVKLTNDIGEKTVFLRI